jgi:hypothetical protein
MHPRFFPVILVRLEKAASASAPHKVLLLRLTSLLTSAGSSGKMQRSTTATTTALIAALASAFVGSVPAAAAAAATNDVSALLRSVTFLNSGTALATSNYTRLEQCSCFTEDESVWLVGNPRTYLWDVTNGTTEATVKAPPMGLRSAVPLGGLGAGTFELRGDGTFADWMVENQGTALAANAQQNSKIPLKGEAFLGVSFRTAGNGLNYSAALRTSPPPGIDGVPALTYSGAYPFSRLVLNDSRAVVPVDAAVYAYTQCVITTVLYFAPAH